MVLYLPSTEPCTEIECMMSLCGTVKKNLRKPVHSTF